MMQTKVVRISKETHDRALKAQNEKFKYMDKGSWLSFLIEKGIEKLTEERV